MKKNKMLAFMAALSAFTAMMIVAAKYGPAMAETGITRVQDTYAVRTTDVIPADPARTPVSDAPSDGRPWLIRVNLTDMVISIYARDAQDRYTRLIKRFIGTAGAYGTPTPQNIYALQTYRDRDHYFAKFDCWAAYATQIDGPFMFHSVIFESPGMRNMNGSYNQLGRAASHGCIRMMPDEAEWIYENCPAGTLVEIYAGEADPDLTESLLPPPSIDGKYPADMPPKVGETKVPAVTVGEE